MSLGIRRVETRVLLFFPVVCLFVLFLFFSLANIKFRKVNAGFINLSFSSLTSSSVVF